MGVDRPRFVVPCDALVFDAFRVSASVGQPEAELRDGFPFLTAVAAVLFHIFLFTVDTRIFEAGNMSTTVLVSSRTRVLEHILEKSSLGNRLAESRYFISMDQHHQPSSAVSKPHGPHSHLGGRTLPLVAEPVE